MVVIGAWATLAPGGYSVALPFGYRHRPAWSSIVLPITVQHDPAEMLPMSSTDGGRWLPLAEAARVLGLRPETVRKQVKRGRRHGRLDNHGRWEVHVEAGMSSIMLDDATRHGSASVLDVTTLLAERDARLARLEGDVADLRAERNRLLAVVERLTAERPERRRWPGLKVWWRRFWAGEG